MSHDANRTDVAKMTSRCLMLLTLFVLTGNMVGCNFLTGIDNYIQYNSTTEDFVSGWRNRVWANRAYNARREMMDPGPYEADYRRGFVAGYTNVAQGGQGCTPSLPPRIYWSWRYQSAEGQVKVQAWYAGFPQGARAAEEDGVGNFYQIQVASWLTDGTRRDCPDCMNESPMIEGLDGDPNLMPQPGVDPNLEELPLQPTPVQPAVPMGTETGMWNQPTPAPAGPQSMPEFREPSVTPATYPANLLDTVELRERQPGEDDAPPPPSADVSLQQSSSRNSQHAPGANDGAALARPGAHTVSYQEAMAGNLRVTVPAKADAPQETQVERFPAVSPDANAASHITDMQTSQLQVPRAPLMRDWNVDLPVHHSSSETEAYPRVALWR